MGLGGVRGDPGPAGEAGGGPRRAVRDATPGARGSRSARSRRSSGTRGSPRPPHWPTSARSTGATAHATPTGGPTGTRSASCGVTCPHHPTSSPIRPTSRTWLRSSTGADRRASPSSPSAAGRRSWAGSRPRWGTASPAWSRSTRPDSTGCWRSTGRVGRPASRPVPSAPSSRTSSGPTGSRCATSPRASSSPRSAAGWPPAPVATTPPSTRTSTTCASRCGWSPRAGVSESRRLPGSGAGPSPDRLFLGSEGTLGVITEAWMRLQDRPRWKVSAGVEFLDLATGAEAVRALAQSGLFPVNCRLLDAGEAMLSARLSPGAGALLVARVRVGRPPGRRPDGPGPRALRRPRRHPARAPDVDGRAEPRAATPGRTAPRRPRQARPASGAIRSCGPRTPGTPWSASG